MLRWPFLQWPCMLRMKCTVQRCQGQPSTLAIAAFRPRWSSETQSLTPSRPRATQLAQEGRPAGLGLRLGDLDADHLAPPDSCTAKATISALEWTWPRSRTLRCLASSQR